MALLSIVVAKSPTDISEFSTVEDLIEECKLENDCEKIIKALVRAKVNFQFYDLDSIELVGINLEDANLDNANLSNADLRIAYLEDVRLKNANLTDTNLNGAYLENVYLRNSTLTGINLENTKLYRVNFTDANLEGAYLVNAELQSEFTNANLRYANLSNIKLSYSNLSDANLEYADLNGAELELTNIGSSNFHGANLNNVILIVPDGLDKSYKAQINAQIKSACNWQQAIYKANWKKGKWIVNEVVNQQYIEQLKQDKASDPKEVVDCSRWLDRK